MAEVYDIDSYRPTRPLQQAPITRNQQLLAEIQASWAARTPEQILTAEINGTLEQLHGVQRRYARLLEARAQLLSPGEIVEDFDGPQSPGHGTQRGRER
jgi:hypothetical protein